MSSPAFVWDVIAGGRKGPGPRSRHGLVYDRAVGATVLFGGIVWAGDGQMRGDTWVLRDGLWSRDRSSGPPARHRGAMVYDERRGVTLLFGGSPGGWNMLADTWTYEPGRWGRRRSWFARGPSPRCGHAMAFDGAAGEIVLFGGINPRDRSLGDTWTWSDGSWQSVRGPGPPARRYAAFAFDPDLGGCVLHGGSVDDQGREQFGDAWLFRDRAWTQLPATFDTSPLDDHGLAYHQAAGRLLMLGGLAGDPGVRIRTGDGWAPVACSPPPPRHQCSPLAWDDALGGLVMHGGETGHGGSPFDVTRVLRIAGG